MDGRHLYKAAAHAWRSVVRACSSSVPGGTLFEAARVRDAGWCSAPGGHLMWSLVYRRAQAMISREACRGVAAQPQAVAKQVHGESDAGVARQPRAATLYRRSPGHLRALHCPLVPFRASRSTQALNGLPSIMEWKRKELGPILTSASASTSPRRSPPVRRALIPRALT